MNSGPKRVGCAICNAAIHDRKETSVRCHLGGWVHLKCSTLQSEREYDSEFVRQRCKWRSKNPVPTCPSEGQPRTGRERQAKQTGKGRPRGNPTVSREDQRGLRRKERKKERRERRQKLKTKLTVLCGTREKEKLSGGWNKRK